MSKPEAKQRAIALRQQGLSYREIRRQVPVAKATLSVWLRSVGLSKPQKQRLTIKRLLAARRGAAKLRRERMERVAQTLQQAEQEARHYITVNDSLWMVGTALYWAEGSKPKPWRTATRVGFANTDPNMILLFRAWLARYCSTAEPDLRYTLQIHERANIEAAVTLWAVRLGIPRGQIHVTMKKHNPSPRRRNLGEAYCGTIQMTVRRSTYLSHCIDGWTRALARHCGVV